MSDNQKTIIDEIHQLNLRLEKVEEYIRHQIIQDPLLMPRVATSTDEDNFHFTFRRQHPGFIPHLRNLLPTITPGEEHLCMMIKLNMTVREMARMLNIDVKSVHTARARLKRKLPLDMNTTMDQWIKRIDKEIE